MQQQTSSQKDSEVPRAMLLVMRSVEPSVMLSAMLPGTPSAMPLGVPLATHWAEPLRMLSVVLLVVSSERSQNLQQVAMLLLAMQRAIPLETFLEIH